MLRRIANRSTQSATVEAFDVAVLACEGEMGEQEFLHLGEQLLWLAGMGYLRVVLDLSAVEHLQYRWIALLTERARQFRALGGEVKLAGLSPYIATIFRVAGADEDFEMYTTDEEAKSAFSQEVSPLRYH